MYQKTIARARVIQVTRRARMGPPPRLDDGPGPPTQPPKSGTVVLDIAIAQVDRQSNNVLC